MSKILCNILHKSQCLIDCNWLKLWIIENELQQWISLTINLYCRRSRPPSGDCKVAIREVLAVLAHCAWSVCRYVVKSHLSSKLVSSNVVLYYNINKIKEASIYILSILICYFYIYNFPRPSCADDPRAITVLPMRVCAIYIPTSLFVLRVVEG